MARVVRDAPRVLTATAPIGCEWCGREISPEDQYLMDVEPMCSWTCFVKDTYACWGPAGPTNAEHQQEIVQ